MSEHDDSWDPADGPPPTEEELAEARAVGDALAGGSHKTGVDGDIDALVEVALRVRATAHPDRARSGHVAAAAVDDALARADARWYRKRWRWVAAVAVALVGIAGVQLAQFRPLRDDTVAISHPATDVFAAGVPENAGSMPIGRITDARLHSYRAMLLHGDDGSR